MDSMVNRYTTDRRIRSDDAYTPGGAGGARPDRCVIVYSQRCREAFTDVPIVIGGIEATLRRIAHYDYWSDKVRRSVLLDAKADLLVYGNAERQIVEIAHRLAAGKPIESIDDLRGTAFVPQGDARRLDGDRLDHDRHAGPAGAPDRSVRDGAAGAPARDTGVGAGDASARAAAVTATTRTSGSLREAVRARDGAAGAPRDGFTASSRSDPEERGGAVAPLPGSVAARAFEAPMRFHRRATLAVDREHS